MVKRDGRSIGIFVLGATISLVLFSIGAGPLNREIDEAMLPFVKTFLAMGALFVSCTLTLWSRFRTLEDATVVEAQKTQDEVYKLLMRERTARFQVFDNYAEALSYELNLIKSSRKIWNTRLNDVHAVIIADLVKTKVGLLTKQDDEIASSVAKRGCHYELIVTPNNSAGIDDMVAKIDGNARTADSITGEFCAWVIGREEQNLPLVQMIIFELTDGTREALVGWVSSEKRIIRPSVIAFRDPDLVSFFRSLFEIYKDYGATINRQE